MTLKQLEQAVLEQRMKERPNIPKHAVPPVKFTDKTANGLQKAIVAHLNLMGHKAWRQNSGGRYIQPEYKHNIMGKRVEIKKGKYIPQGKAGGKGAGDVVATLKPWGKSCHIEVKIGKDRQHESQIEFQQEHEAAGGIYMIVKNWEQYIDQIKPWIK